MRGRFRRDLIRWEAGLITTAQLADTHPSADVTGITGVHARLTLLTAEASPDPEASWETLRSRLPQRSRAASPRLRARRAVAAAAAAAMLGGTSLAYAAGVEQVRGGVDAIIDGISSVVGGSPNRPSAPATHDGGADSARNEDQETLEPDEPREVQPDDGTDRSDRGDTEGGNGDTEANIDADTEDNAGPGNAADDTNND